MKNQTTLRGIVLSDIHFGIKQSERLYDELQGVFIPYLKDNVNDIDLLVINGDYFDRKLDLNQNSSKLAIKFMNEVSSICKNNDIRIRVVKGTSTHDFTQLDNFKTLELEMNFRIINTCEVEELFPQLSILWLPEEYMEDHHEYRAPLYS